MLAQMKELDRECVEQTKELNSLEEQYLANATLLAKNKKTMTAEAKQDVESRNCKLMEFHYETEPDKSWRRNPPLH